MKGYRTLVLNSVSLVASVLLMAGIEVDAEQQAQIATGLLAIINVANLALRTVTNTPIGEK